MIHLKSHCPITPQPHKSEVLSNHPMLRQRSPIDSISYGKAKKQADVVRRRTQANTAGPYWVGHFLPHMVSQKQRLLSFGPKREHPFTRAFSGMTMMMSGGRGIKGNSRE